MHETKNWYAVYTRPGQERKVTESLTRKRIENYCPLAQVTEHAAGNKKILQKPLFDSYTFARMGEIDFPHLNRTDGVISCLFWLGKPAVIPDPEIETIREFVNKYSDIKLRRVFLQNPTHKQSFTLNDKIVFNEKNKTFSAMLPSLGYLMLAESEALRMEAIVKPLLQRWTKNWIEFEHKILHAMQFD